VAQLLASTLGSERSAELVFAVVRDLGLDASKLAADEALQILEILSRRPGIVGITSRFAMARLAPAAPDSGRGRAPSPDSQPGASRAPPSGHQTRAIAAEERVPPSQVQPATLPLDLLAGLLAPSMGNERAEELVRAATRGYPTDGGRITHADAVAVLEALAQQPGIVGVTARFAKVRFALRWKG